MKNAKIFSLIQIDEYSATPKYLQLTNSILNGIEAGKIVKDELLPSINELSFELEIARDTEEKGYKYLKKLGVLGSVPGKGYFIKNADFRHSLKIFLLFNKLSVHKKMIYDAFIAALGEHLHIRTLSLGYSQMLLLNHIVHNIYRFVQINIIPQVFHPGLNTFFFILIA